MSYFNLKHIHSNRFANAAAVPAPNDLSKRPKLKIVHV